MKHVIAFVVLSLSLMWAGAANAGTYDDAMKTYLAAGQKIIDMVNSNKVDVGTVEKNVLVAVNAGIELAQAYAKKHPEGKAALDAVISNAANSDGTAVGNMSKLPFATIEADWHDAAYFSKNDLGVDLQDEDNEHYLDPIHTIVHPIMVLVAARDHAKDGNADSLKAMKAEMQEGMEQVEATTHVVNN
ncbi:MAG: hypothetical protein QF521_07345 [Alphaproteobacteria bacterium]|nr:hypothetical protein [Alphaproteobacteria bacterium]